MPWIQTKTKTKWTQATTKLFPQFPTYSQIGAETHRAEQNDLLRTKRFTQNVSRVEIEHEFLGW